MSLPQLYVDIGVGLIDALPHGNQAVVDADRPNDENDYDAKDDHGRSGHSGAPKSRLDGATAFITAIDSIAKYSGCARARRELAAWRVLRELRQDNSCGACRRRGQRGTMQGKIALEEHFAIPETLED